MAYPDGVDHGWNDGRGVGPDVDDVAFLETLLQNLDDDFSIDRARVYVTGISNGGMMAMRFACDRADLVAAIAPVSALLPRALQARRPARSVPVVLFNGTADPVMPYDGGAIGRAGERGAVLSAAQTASWWAARDGCARPCPATPLEVLDSTDPTRVTEQRWESGRADAEVVQLTIEGGGHTWPGGQPYRSAGRGATSRNIDACLRIWRFFSRHPSR